MIRAMFSRSLYVGTMTRASPVPAPRPSSAEGAAFLGWTLPDDVDESTKIADRSDVSTRTEDDPSWVRYSRRVRTREKKTSRDRASDHRDAARIALGNPDLL